MSIVLDFYNICEDIDIIVLHTKLILKFIFWKVIISLFFKIYYKIEWFFHKYLKELLNSNINF